MIWWSIPIVTVLALNVVATAAACRSHYPTARHLILQLTVVWFLPVFGAVGLLLFVRSQSSYDPIKNFDPLYTPSDGSQPHQDWIPEPSDLTGSGDGDASD